MVFMPFQILGIWLRGLLALALLGGGIYLLAEWFNNRETYVREPGPVVKVRPDEGRAVEDEPAPPREVRIEHVRRVPWQFGWNKETAFLLGGLGLLTLSFGGGFLSPRRFLRRRGGDVPRPAGEVQRLRRPDGTELHVELYGPADAPPVVLTHGWGVDSEEWNYVKEQLTRDYRVIVWDLPGLGRSTRPANNDFSLEKMARDLDAVLALAGDRPARLVGHSIGGMIMLTFCRLFPEALGRRVHSLTLVHTTYTNPVRTTNNAWFYTAIQKPVLEPLCYLMIWLAPLVWLMNALSYLNGSAHRSTERSSFSGRETWEQLDFMARYYVTAWPGVIGRGMLAMFRYDATDVLGRLTVPALVVAGDQDNLCRPEASGFMAEAIPAARLVTLRPARHSGHFEHHDPFDRQLAEFGGATPAPAAQAARV